MPVSLGACLVWLLFPAIVAASILFPVYAIWRYRIISVDGEGEKVATLRRTFVLLGIGLSLAAYVILVVGIFSPTIVSSLSRFIESGGLAGVVPLIFVDVALGAIFSRERALRRRQMDRPAALMPPR
jgi:hypothetical protein